MEAMVGWLKFLKEKKEKTVLVLDIGTEAVKGLLCKKENGKTVIAENFLEYLDEFGTAEAVFDSRNLRRVLLEKIISRIIEKTKNSIGKFPQELFWGLTADIFKERISRQNFIRKNPQELVQKKEKDEIRRKIFDETSKEILKQGFLTRDLFFAIQKILGIEIDGYSVQEIENYRGKNLNFKVLSAFLPLSYFKEIEDIFQKFHFSKNRKIVLLSEGLTSFVKEKSDNFIFINIGGKITQIFLTKEDKIEKIDEFKIGGAVFSESLSEKLGLRLLEARILKERYGKGELSRESTLRIKEILSEPCQTWFSAFKTKLGEMAESRLLPQKIGIFGGGSLLPEIKEVLETGNWEGFSFTGQREVKSISLDDFKNTEDLTRKLNDPQFISPLLMTLVHRNGHEAKNF